MTDRERVLATLSHRQPDRTPYQIGFTQPAYARMAEYLGDADFDRDLGNCLISLGVEPRDGWRSEHAPLRTSPTQRAGTDALAVY